MIKGLISIFAALIADVVDNVQTSMHRAFEDRIRKVSKKLIAIFLVIAGIIFGLNGIAVLIDAYVGNLWIGHLSVGAVVLIFGIAFLNNNH